MPREIAMLQAQINQFSETAVPVPVTMTHISEPACRTVMPFAFPANTASLAIPSTVFCPDSHLDGGGGGGKGEGVGEGKDSSQ